jgi:TRAP-type C4-dicarboxylate transport system permease small subunit
MTRYRKLVGCVIGIVIAAAVIIIAFFGYQYFDGVGYSQDEKIFDKASVYMEVMK